MQSTYENSENPTMETTNKDALRAHSHGHTLRAIEKDASFVGCNRGQLGLLHLTKFSINNALE